MIKYINTDDEITLEVKGSTQDMIVNTAMLIGAIYSKLDDVDKEVYRNILINGITDDDFWNLSKESFGETDPNNKEE